MLARVFKIWLVLVTIIQFTDHNNFFPIYSARHFGSYKESKLSVTRRKGRNSTVKSCQLSWAGQYKKCIQYNFKFTSENSDPKIKWFTEPSLWIVVYLLFMCFPSFGYNMIETFCYRKIGSIVGTVQFNKNATQVR